jgi:transposase-like protein
VLAYMTFAAQHRTKLHSTNPLERLNKMGPLALFRAQWHASLGHAAI